MGHTLGSKLFSSRETGSVSPFSGTVKSNQSTCSGCPFPALHLENFSMIKYHGGKRSLLIHSNAKLQFLKQSLTKIDPQSGNYSRCFLFCFFLISWTPFGQWNVAITKTSSMSKNLCFHLTQEIDNIMLFITKIWEGPQISNKITGQINHEATVWWNITHH